MQFTVSGIDGWLDLLGCLVFLIAAIVAYFVQPLHRLVLTLIAFGLFLVTLTTLVR